jgi:hypothetical protein
MTKQLSPAAQAVLDAFNNRGLSSREWHDGKAASLKLAAALRAAADQIAPDEPHPGESQFWDDEADWEWQNNQHFRKKLLAIADELEGK